MRKSLYAGLATLALSMIIPEADAQSRMGRGRNLGKQRPAPMQQEAAKPPVAAPGTPVAIEIRGRQLPARIVARPFYRRVRREE